MVHPAWVVLYTVTLLGQDVESDAPPQGCAALPLAALTVQYVERCIVTVVPARFTTLFQLPDLLWLHQVEHCACALMFPIDVGDPDVPSDLCRKLNLCEAKHSGMKKICVASSNLRVALKKDLTSSTTPLSPQTRTDFTKPASQT